MPRSSLLDFEFNLYRSSLQKMSYHDGSAGTYYCHTVLFPEKKIVVIIIANTATEEAVSAIYDIQKWISDNQKKAKK